MQKIFNTFTRARKYSNLASWKEVKQIPKQQNWLTKTIQIQAPQNLQFYPVENKPLETIKDETIKVISYNILAESLSLRHSQLYPHISPEMLLWENRMNLLVKQINELDSDFYCLQEVDNFKELKTILEPTGLSGKYLKRSSFKNQDGCAIFWKKDRFDHLTTKYIEFNPTHDIHEGYDNVALCSFFRLKSNIDKIICVVSTHLLFNPQRGDIKLAQAQNMLLKIQKYISEIQNQNENSSISLVVAGDMNSTPYSGIWEFLQRGNLNLKLSELPFWRQTISGQQISSRKIQNIDLTDCIKSLSKLNVRPRNEKYCFHHNFNFGSAYENYNELHEKIFDNSIESTCSSSLFNENCSGEPRVTSVIDGCTNAVDSIWFCKNSLQLKSLLELPQQNYLLHSPHNLPSLLHPSDHFILGAEFILKE